MTGIPRRTSGTGAIPRQALGTGAIISADPTWIENRPDTEIAARLLNDWCLRNGIMPGAFNSGYDERFRGRAFTEDGYFRRVLDPRPETVDIISYDLKAAVVAEENVSPETIWCSHSMCKSGAVQYDIIKEPGSGTQKDEVEKKWVWFCRQEEGIFPAYLKGCEPELRGPTADLLRDPATGTNWFSRYVAQAYYQMLKERHQNALGARGVKITEADNIFTTDPELVQKTVPHAGGVLFRGVKVVGIRDHGYAFCLNGERYVSGARINSRLFPDMINEGLERLVDARIDQADTTPVLGKIAESLGFVDPEELVVETVITREPEEYGRTTRVELAIKKSAGFALDRLEAEGSIAPRSRTRTEKRVGRWTGFVLTRERAGEEGPAKYLAEASRDSPDNAELRELARRAQFVRVRDVRDPGLDWSLVHRQAYLDLLASPVVKRITMLDTRQVGLGAFG